MYKIFNLLLIIFIFLFFFNIYKYYSSNTNIKNALFVGSTNELQKMLNRKDDEVIEGTETSTKQDNTGIK